MKCLLDDEKDKDNNANAYNHNFEGLYCICNKTFDPSSKQEETMYQCTICEDWFHPSCLINVRCAVTAETLFNLEFIWKYQLGRTKRPNWWSMLQRLYGSMFILVEISSSCSKTKRPSGYF
jgi:hypothetical protein